MRAGVLYILIFGLLFLILSILFTVNLFLQSKTDTGEEPASRGIPAKAAETAETGWTRFMSEKPIVKDYYPANEIILSWDLVEADKLRDTLYRVAFENLDKYQYFCLIQVLNNHNVRRSIEKVNDTYHVILSLYSPAAADVLMQELAEYDIQGNISKYKSEIKYNQ